MIELEGKFKLDSSNETREKIKQISKLEEITLEENCVFPLKESYIRFRKTETRNYFTYKGKNKSSKFNKVREIEFNVPKFIFDIARSFSKYKYRKVRETYSHKNALICLDFVFDLGYFVEIEAKSEEDISFIKKQLNISSPNINDHYWKLIKPKYL